MPTTESQNSPPSTKSPVPVGQFSLTLLSNGRWTIQPNSSPPSENSLPSYMEWLCFFRDKLSPPDLEKGFDKYWVEEAMQFLAQRG